MKFSSDGEVCDLPDDVGKHVGRATGVDTGGSLGVSALSRIVDAVDKILKGEMPRDFEPHGTMPQRLNEWHVSLVMDHMAGVSIEDLARTHDYHPNYIALILRHPDATTLKSLVLGARGDRLTDIQARLEHLAPEALTKKVELMRTARSEGIQNEAASDILRLAGYGERKKETVVKHELSIVMPAQAATGLTAALEESRRVAIVDYSAYVTRPSEGEATDRLQQGAEHTSAGSLPTASPALRLEPKERSA